MNKDPYRKIEIIPSIVLMTLSIAVITIVVLSEITGLAVFITSVQCGLAFACALGNIPND